MTLAKQQNSIWSILGPPVSKQSNHYSSMPKYRPSELGPTWIHLQYTPKIGKHLLKLDEVKLIVKQIHSWKMAFMFLNLFSLPADGELEECKSCRWKTWCTKLRKRLTLAPMSLGLSKLQYRKMRPELCKKTQLGRLHLERFWKKKMIIELQILHLEISCCGNQKVISQYLLTRFKNRNHEVIHNEWITLKDQKRIVFMKSTGKCIFVLV